MRLHLRDSGGDGPPVVFLHGGGLDAGSWDGVVADLRADHRCIAVDQRGHGASPWAADGAYGLEDHIADLADLLAELGLERPALVGQSMGGMNALAGDLHTVRCPVLVVHGARSRVITEADAAGFAAAVPDGELAIVGGAGHNVQAEQPAALAGLIRRFVFARS